MTIKILTICDYGQNRSVGMKCYLNGLNRGDAGRINNLMYDVIAVGSITSSAQTMKMLKVWADIIIDVRKWLPVDIYAHAWDDDLQDECKKIWWDILDYPKYKELFKLNSVRT